MVFLKFFIFLVVMVFSLVAMMKYDTTYYSTSHKIRNNVVFVIVFLLALAGLIGTFYYGYLSIVTIISFLGSLLIR